MTVPIWHPKVRAEALRYGITDFQAYRRINDRERIREMQEEARQNNIRSGIVELDKRRPSR